MPKFPPLDLGYLNVKDFGAVGDDVHDDAPAFQAMFDAMIASQEHKICFIPQGRYRWNSRVIIQNSDPDVFVRNFIIQGSGGSFAYGRGSEIRYDGDPLDADDVLGALVLKGLAHVSIREICFRLVSTLAASGIETLLRIEHGIIDGSTGISTHIVDIYGCQFRHTLATSLSEAAVWVMNTKSVKFSHCRFATQPTALRLGDNIVNHPNTYLEGRCKNTLVENCYFDASLDIRNAAATKILGCQFDGFVDNDATNKIISTGDKLMGSLSVDSCAFVGNHADPSAAGYVAITQGDGDPELGADRTCFPALSVTNCVFKTCRTGIQLTVGNAFIAGNVFTIRSLVADASLYTGIVIDAGVEYVDIDNNNNFDGLEARFGTPITDNRADPRRYHTRIDETWWFKGVNIHSDRMASGPPGLSVDQGRQFWYFSNLRIATLDTGQKIRIQWELAAIRAYALHVVFVSSNPDTLGIVDKLFFFRNAINAITNTVVDTRVIAQFAGAEVDIVHKGSDYAFNLVIQHPAAHVTSIATWGLSVDITAVRSTPLNLVEAVVEAI